jgi:MoxR-like ATPase
MCDLECEIMTWRIEADNRAGDKERLSRLPKPLLFEERRDSKGRALLAAEGYVTSPPLLAAVNTSIALGQPLLVTGEPGTGKTELAYYLAARLGFAYRDEVIRFDVKSASTSRDFLYHYDALSHFHAVNTRKESPPTAAEFITFVGLGQAIVNAADKRDAQTFLGREPKGHPGEPRRSVVLIDEVDKAPRDVPNDLLREIETMEFHIPELGTNAVFHGDPALRPIVVITSNSEKALPEAFLRRCCFFHIAFPNPPDDFLRDVVAKRLQGMPRDAELVSDAIDVFAALRDRRARLVKPPGTAELLGFVMDLRDAGYEPSSRLYGNSDWHQTALATLCKTTDDRVKGARQLDNVDIFKSNKGK